MTYAEIIAVLRRGKCDATADAFERAVRDESRALLALPDSQWKRETSALESARVFYANDITVQLLGPEQPTPSLMLSNRRFPVVWAVAEVLRTNGLAP